MDITQKQFQKAKQNFNLNVAQDDKYTKELETQAADGSLTYRKSDETYLAFGSIAKWLRNGSEQAQSSSSDQKDLDNMSLDDVESMDDVSDMIWSQIEDGKAVEDSRIYYLSSKYKGARKIMIAKPSGFIQAYQVVSIPDNPQKKSEKLGTFRAESFEDVLNQMDYEVEEE
jgi:hypothetical protein